MGRSEEEQNKITKRVLGELLKRKQVEEKAKARANKKAKKKKGN